MIWTPGYHPESPGTHTLYQLARTLAVDLSCRVSLSVHGPEEDLPPALARLPRQPADRPPSAADVVVYPELVAGNPLAGQRVLRYLLHGSGALSTGPGDFVATADPTATHLAFPALLAIDEGDAFFSASATRRPRGTALVDLGPGEVGALPAAVRTFLDGFARRVVISRYHPGRRAALGELFRGASVLVSAGGSLARRRQATLCGTPVLRVGGPAGELPCGEFQRPEDFGAAEARVREAHALHLRELAGNPARVQALVSAVRMHFEALESGGPSAAPLLELGRQAAALRARVLVAPSSAAAAPPPPPAPAPPDAAGPAPRYQVVDSLNLVIKQTGPLHTALKKAVVRAAGFRTEDPHPPVRHQLADTVNVVVKRFPRAHATLRKAVRRNP